jgi:hypothetical protein
MATTKNKVLKLATTESSHTCITPPAISNIPPMTPPKPDGIPAPFPYFGQSSTGEKTGTKLKIAKGKALLKGKSLFKVDKPGNQPSQPAPLHDLVTMQVNAKFKI